MRKMTNKEKSFMSYEPEADVFTVEFGSQPIDHAKEIGNIVVHFTKEDIPVLIEILEASKFLTKVRDLVRPGRSLKKLSLAVR